MRLKCYSVCIYCKTTHQRIAETELKSEDYIGALVLAARLRRERWPEGYVGSVKQKKGP